MFLCAYQRQNVDRLATIKNAFLGSLSRKIRKKKQSEGTGIPNALVYNDTNRDHNSTMSSKNNATSNGTSVHSDKGDGDNQGDDFLKEYK